MSAWTKVTRSKCKEQGGAWTMKCSKVLVLFFLWVLLLLLLLLLVMVLVMVVVVLVVLVLVVVLVVVLGWCWCWAGGGGAGAGAGAATATAATVVVVVGWWLLVGGGLCWLPAVAMALMSQHPKYETYGLVRTAECNAMKGSNLSGQASSHVQEVHASCKVAIWEIRGQKWYTLFETLNSSTP